MYKTNGSPLRSETLKIQVKRQTCSIKTTIRQQKVNTELQEREEVQAKQ